MASFGKKKKITEYLYSKPGIVIVAILVVFLASAVFKRYTVEREMAQRQQETQQSQAELLERQKTLKERVDYLSGDRGIEEEIRKHFDVAKEGEKVIILVGDQKEKTQEEVPVTQKKPWYRFW